VPAASGVGSKRRVQQAPRQFQLPVGSRLRTSQRAGDTDLASGVLKPALKRASTFSGSLCAVEVAAGFGMGMAVSSGPSFLHRQLSSAGRGAKVGRNPLSVFLSLI
jgi:hypothetical protein